MRFVLDASAVLALIQGEPGRQRVRAVVQEAAISSVNLTEVITKLVAKGVTSADVTTILDDLVLDVHPHDQALAVAAGVMHATTQARGSSLGDRACLALAQRLGATALTTDRAWAAIDVGVEVELIR